MTLWTVACQTPLSMGFSRQKYWSGLPYPHPGDLPDLGIEPMSHEFGVGRQVLYHYWHVKSLLYIHICISSVSSIAQSCLTVCDPMEYSMPGFPVHHQLPEFIQTKVYWVNDAIQSSHPLSSPSPHALSLSQHMGLFQWVSSSYQVAKVLKLQFQHQSFQSIFWVDFL